MSIKTAVIGAGVMGKCHLDQLIQMDDVEVAALVDPHEPATRAAAEKYHISATYGDIEAMLTDIHPEYVVVASPVRYHAVQAIAAFNAGSHVLVEKPLCMSMEEAAAIKAAAIKAGRLFTMGFQMRQHRGYRALAEFLAEGKLGQVYHSRVWGGHVMNYPWGRYFHKKEESLGGVVVATVVHPLDALYWILGAPEPMSVSASVFCKLNKMPNPPINFEGTVDEVSVEDFAHAHVRFVDGSSMSIEGNWLMHPTQRSMGFEIHGLLGMGRSITPHVKLEDGKEIIPHEFKEQTGWGDQTRLEHEEFITAIQGHGKPMVSFREALNVHKIMTGLYDSAEQGCEVVF